MSSKWNKSSPLNTSKNSRNKTGKLKKNIYVKLTQLTILTVNFTKIQPLHRYLCFKQHWNWKLETLFAFGTISALEDYLTTSREALILQILLCDQDYLRSINLFHTAKSEQNCILPTSLKPFLSAKLTRIKLEVIPNSAHLCMFQTFSSKCSFAFYFSGEKQQGRDRNEVKLERIYVGLNQANRGDLRCSEMSPEK